MGKLTSYTYADGNIPLEKGKMETVREANMFM